MKNSLEKIILRAKKRIGKGPLPKGQPYTLYRIQYNNKTRVVFGPEAVAEENRVGFSFSLRGELYCYINSGHSGIMSFL